MGRTTTTQLGQQPQLQPQGQGYEFHVNPEAKLSQPEDLLALM